jgi:hypothetical protein
MEPFEVAMSIGAGRLKDSFDRFGVYWVKPNFPPCQRMEPFEVAMSIGAGKRKDSFDRFGVYWVPCLKHDNLQGFPESGKPPVRHPLRKSQDCRKCNFSPNVRRRKTLGELVLELVVHYRNFPGALAFSTKSVVLPLAVRIERFIG